MAWVISLMLRYERIIFLSHVVYNTVNSYIHNRASRTTNLSRKKNQAILFKTKLCAQETTHTKAQIQQGKCVGTEARRRGYQVSCVKFNESLCLPAA